LNALEISATIAGLRHINLAMNMRNNMSPYERRVRELEEEGLTTSDAQSVADVEFELLPAYDDYYKIVEGTLR
jgi:hypothetical protein